MFLFHVSWEIKHPWIWNFVWMNHYFNSSNKQKYIAGWWLNQPIRKKCSSKWVHLPRFSGWKFQKMCFLNHHPVFRFTANMGWFLPWQPSIHPTHFHSTQLLFAKSAASAERDWCLGQFHQGLALVETAWNLENSWKIPTRSMVIMM